MAKGKETPRQKMINLMYLVFIAMLAMQIDQEIIRSYNDTKESLQETRLLTQSKNAIFENTLKAKAQNSEEFVIAYEQYLTLKSQVDGLINILDEAKAKMSDFAGNDPSGKDFNFNALNNTDASTLYFFTDANEAKPTQNASDLVKRVNDLRNFITTSFGNDSRMKQVVERAGKSLITTKTKNNKDWLVSKFYNQPLVAALSSIEIIQAEVRNIESDVLANMLQEKVDADIKFDAYQAIVSAPTTVVQGETAVAKVSIGNYSSNVPGLSMPGLTVQNGQGIATLNTSTVGNNKPFSGFISFKDANGKEIKLEYNHTYNVIAGVKEVALQSGAIVSADNMNILYRGLANPVSGSILGADNTATSLSAQGATVSGGKGKWMVTPGAGASVTLTISGKDPKGKPISQSFPFRVKNVPPPQGQIRGKVVSTMPASSIPLQKVEVEMPDFGFPVSFNVNSFMFKAPGKPAMQVNGNSLSSVEGLTKNLRSGDIVYIFKINATATGLGGQILKEIPPVVINVQ